MENELKNCIQETKKYKFIKIIKNCKDFVMVKIANSENRKFDAKCYKNKYMY